MSNLWRSTTLSTHKGQLFDVSPFCVRKTRSLFLETGAYSRLPGTELKITILLRWQCCKTRTWLLLRSEIVLHKLRYSMKQENDQKTLECKWSSNKKICRIFCLRASDSRQRVWKITDKRYFKYKFPVYHSMMAWS